jgi:hypothetical protein
MSRSCSTIAAATLCFTSAAPAAEIEFVKTHIDKAFRAEGVAVADVDGDGKKDILAGPLWYRAPDWKPHEIAQVKEFQPEKGYSESFSCFADDLSGDGRPDLIVVGMPGAPVRIYENPGPDKLGAHWKEHQAFPSATNESPAYTDLDGDGKREMVCGFEPDEKMAWFSPGARIGDPWTCHPLSGPKARGAQKFHHGLGIGDVNKDGRLDVVIRQGWYEAPADRKAAEWTFHESALGPDCAHMHVLDLDGDGDQDVLSSSAHQYGIWWHEQAAGEDGKARWTQHEIDKSYSQTHSLVVADLNGDGRPDFVTGRRWMAHMGGDPGEKERHPAVLHWYELQPKEGKPTWVKHSIDQDSGVGTQFEVTDVNGDGLLDIAISNKLGVFFFQQARKAKAAN